VGSKVALCTRTHTHTHTHILIHTHTYTPIHIHTHTHTYVEQSELGIIVALNVGGKIALDTHTHNQTHTHVCVPEFGLGLGLHHLFMCACAIDCSGAHVLLTVSLSTHPFFRPPPNTYNPNTQLFTSSYDTFTRVKDSLLAGMLCGRFPVSRDFNGNIFIDRDPKLFRSVLNFLRDEHLSPPKQHDKVHYFSSLPHTATHCRTLQHSAVHPNKPQRTL